MPKLVSTFKSYRLKIKYLLPSNLLQLLNNKFNKFRKISFGLKMKKGAKKFPVETEVNNSLDLGDKNRKN